MENAGELVSLGADIMKLGAELKMAREELVEVQARVKQLEGELQPKIMRHAQLIHEAAGMTFSLPSAPSASPESSFPAPAPRGPLPDWAPARAKAEAAEEPFVGSDVQVTAAGVADGNGMRSSLVATPGQQRPPARENPQAQMKARVKQFLKTRKSDEPISASDIAEVLHIDALVVREAMRELQTGR